jgi:serine/threonine-protein kinase RsbW
VARFTSCEKNAEQRRKSHVFDSKFHRQVDTVVLRAAPPQWIWTFSFRAVWALAGTRLNTRVIMSRMEAPNRRTAMRAHLPSTRGGSLLEVDIWMPSELKAISPLVDRLMRLIEGSRCIAGEEYAVELGLREALSNAVIHGNRLDAHKLVHVRCRCKVGKEISLIVSDQGQGFDVQTVFDSVAVEDLEAEHGRGIQLMKSVMDEVSFQQRGTEVHMCKRLARDVRTNARE